MINIVISLTKVKVHDVHRIDLFDFGIRLSFGDMLHDDLGRAVKHPLKVVRLPGILDFDDDQLTRSVFHENIYPIELVVLGLFISFTFKDLFYLKKSSRSNSDKKPSKISKLALLRSSRFIAQSNRTNFFAIIN
jgi:hypothetical protein